MPTFLFWNINEKPLARRIARIVSKEVVDVVVLTECTISSLEMIQELEALGQNGFTALEPINGRFRLYHRTEWKWDNRYDGESWQVYRIRGRPFQKALVTVAHLRSKLRANSPADQESHAVKLMNILRHWEKRLNVDHVILLATST